MDDIKANTIANDVGHICDAVMMKVIPALNAANHEIRVLQGRLAALEGSGPKVASKPSVVATAPAPPAEPAAPAPKQKRTKKA